MADYDIDYDCSCPKCGHSPTHSRDCINWCNDGVLDMSDDDPINFAPGEIIYPCPDCKGTGIERWCPNCGAELSGESVSSEDEYPGEYPDE